MRVITIKQPWAFLICNGIKDVENRTWELPKKFRGKRVLIHASKDASLDTLPLDRIYTSDQLKELLTRYSEYELCKMTFEHGAIIGAVQFTDCVKDHPSVWSIDGQYQWTVQYPQLFDKPVQAEGKLRFWWYPHIVAEQEEDGGELFCHCQVATDVKDHVYSLMGECRCHYCGGKWYH